MALRAAGFRVLRYDMYGRGYSDRPDVDYTLDLLDRQLVGLLDSLQLRDPIDLVGLSMGGAVVANFANQHTARMRTLTFVDPVRPAVDARLRCCCACRGSERTSFKPPRCLSWPTARRAISCTPSASPIGPIVRTQMRFRGFGRAMRSTTLANTKLDIDSMYRRTGQLTVPTLLIWGSEDKQCRSRSVTACAATFRAPNSMRSPAPATFLAWRNQPRPMACSCNSCGAINRL